MNVDLVFEDGRWKKTLLGEVSRTVFKETLNFFGQNASDFSIDILACNDGRISELNKEFRGNNSATNVLSWPSKNFQSKFVKGNTDSILNKEDGFLGDIAISYDTCVKEAKERAIDFVDHISHLMIHSILHLMGYDHILEVEEEKMKKIEIEILGKMGIDSPYI